MSAPRRLARALPPALSLLLASLLWAAPARAIEVQQVISPGGIEALLVEDHTNPIIALELGFRGGGALDPEGKEGLANLVSGLLDEGAGALDSQAFQARLAEHSIRLSFDSGLDTFEGSLQTLTENRDEAFELLQMALTEPRFDAEPLERISGQILAQIRAEAEDPSAIAGRTLRRLFFAGHPYGRPPNGTPESIARIGAEDLRGFVTRRIARDVLEIGVVGDITAGQLSALLDRTFLGLPESAADGALADVEPGGAGDQVVVMRKIPQSIVSFGHRGISRDDPDYYAAYVVNYVLGGGGFSSRLYEEVRERRGLAYSVYSYLSPFEHAALVIGGVATQNARVAESLALVRQEWARMAEEGPSAEELADAKTYLTGSFPLRLSSSSGIAGLLLGIQIEELGMDYLDRRNGYIEAVTPDDARRVARRLYDASALTVVVVGSPDGVEANREAPPIN